MISISRYLFGHSITWVKLTQVQSYLNSCLFFKLHDVPSDPRKAGKCAFASRDIKKCEVICEYEGEVVSIEEARRREENYQEEGKVCALMVLESAGRQIA